MDMEAKMTRSLGLRTLMLVAFVAVSTATIIHTDALTGPAPAGHIALDSVPAAGQD
jgi:hypothetical protein